MNHGAAQGGTLSRPELLEGGDAVAGRKVFFERQEAGCLKCHNIGGLGGVVGPNLSAIGGQRSPAQLLDSLLYPNKEIAPEFRTVTLFTADDSCNGRILHETETQVVLMNSEGREVTVDKSKIEARRDALSAMPENVTELLKPRDIRDLVAYLSSLKPPTTSATTK
jgi:quinoprotein glucose dehydrogenase